MANRYGPNELADDIFTSFLRANANYALALQKEEGDYFLNLSNMVRESQAYNNTTLDGTPNGMTDWEFGASELKEAANIYCGGDSASCYDSGQDSQGRLVGMLTTAFDRNKEIFDNTQVWIDNFAGKGGWLDKVEKYQDSFGGKEGTVGAIDLLNELGNFLKVKNEIRKTQITENLSEEAEREAMYIQQAASLGQIDLSPGNPMLDFMPSPFSDEIVGNESKGIEGAVGPPMLDADGNPTNPNWIQYFGEYAKEAELTSAVELLKIGDVEGSKAAHKRWMASIDDRFKARMKVLDDMDKADKAATTQALEDREKALTKYSDDYFTAVKFLNTLELNLGSDKTGLEYKPEFKESLKSVVEGTAFASGALNLETLPGFKRGLARNLANWMNEYSEGPTHNEWISDHNRVRELYTDSNGELKIPKSMLDILAVEAFFGPSNEIEIGKMVEGGSEVFPVFGDYGMDFPGHGWIGPSEAEENAEEYMLQTYKIWALINKIENDPDIQMPSEDNVNNIVNPHDPHGLLKPSMFSNPWIISEPDTNWTLIDKSALISEPDTSAAQPDSSFMQQGSGQDIQQSVPRDTIDGPIDIPIVTQSPLDSALNSGSITDPALGADVRMDAANMTESDVMKRAVDKGFTPAQIAAAKPMIVKFLRENTDEMRPEATWYITYADFIDSADVYRDLKDYLDVIGHNARD